MKYINRFDGKGEIYAKARPEYAEELFDYLKILCIFLPAVFLRISVRERGFLPDSL